MATAPGSDISGSASAGAGQEPQFDRAPDGLYWLRPAGGEAPLPIACLIAGEDLPATLTLSETWSTYPGSLYAFLPEIPSDRSAFAIRLAAYAAAEAGQSIRFAWIETPTSPYPEWVTHAITARTDGTTWTTARTAAIDLVNYALIVGGAAPITLRPTGTAGAPAGFAFGRAPAGPQSLRFTADWGRASYAETRGEITLPFEGAAAGTLAFDILVPADADDPDVPMARLGTGLRYFVADPEWPGTDLVKSLRYPVLMPTADLSLHGMLDPSRPLDTARSAFALLAAPGGGTAIPSTWRTALGHGVDLTPVRTADDAGARFVFAVDVPGVTPVARPPLYLTLEGDWGVAFTSGNDNQAAAAAGAVDIREPVQRLMPGIAATEYIGVMRTGTTQTLQFRAGHPAFAAPGTEIESLSSLGGWATTSWVYVGSSGDDLTYFAQPEDSEFYHWPETGAPIVSMARRAAPPVRATSAPRADGVPTGLVLLEVPASNLPPPGAQTVFPAVPYAGIVEADLSLARTVEEAVLSPVRRGIIRDLPEGPTDPRPTAFEVTDADPTGYTPQGLTCAFSTDLLTWEALTLARTLRTVPLTPTPQLIEQDLIFADVEGPLRAALQTNQLFLVMSDPAAVLDAMSVTFRMTADSFGEFKASKGPDGQPVPQTVIDALIAGGIVDTYYPDLDAYDAALAHALTGAELAVWRPNLLYYGAFADVTIADWLFHLSPYHWNWSETTPTIAVFKFAGRSLSDLISDLSAWTWKDAAGGEAGAAAVQQRLERIVADAKTAAEQGAVDFDDFVAMAENPYWNGILFFDVAVSLSDLPSELQGLAAGIDPAAFRAHHIGIDVSPIHTDGPTPTIGNSTLFGLIHYADPVDIPYDHKDYDFKVLTLSIVFRNSQIASFASTIEVQINTMFGEAATLEYAENGNNVVLTGAYQQHGETSSYVFVQSLENVFQMTSDVLDTVDVLQVNFVTAVPANPATGSTRVQCRFVMTGVLRFKAMAGFDVFSYGDGPNTTGGLRFDGLVIEMDFDQSDPTARVFTFRVDLIGIDLAASVARPGSFVAHFPLAFKSLMQGAPDKTPADFGYMAVSNPLPQGRMSPPWYGLTFQLELGSLGALAASAGLTTTLIAAWSASTTGPQVYVGLKMPGSVGAETRIPIEGILNLNFKKIEIVVVPGTSPTRALPASARPLPALPAPTGAQGTPAPSERGVARVVEGGRRGAADDDSATTQYMLKFRGVSFSLLSLSFPPGTIDVYLFGNPDTGNASLLGWYAAYVQSE